MYVGVAPSEEHRPCDLQVEGSSNPACRAPLRSGLWQMQATYTGVPLCPSSINWYGSNDGDASSETGKVTVGLATYWPYVTDLLLLAFPSNTVSKADDREMSTPPIRPHSGMAPFTFSLFM